MNLPAQRNPSAALAGFGALVGGVVGGLSAAAVTFAALRLRDGPEAEHYAEGSRDGRLLHLLVGSGTALGSAYGAYLGATPQQQERAVTGALLGSSAVVLPTIALNPEGPGTGMWDWIGGSVGAGIGAVVGARGR